MKLLWFTNTYVPNPSKSDLQDLRGSGGWMLSLLRHLQRNGDYRIAVATARPVRRLVRYTVDNIDCFIIPVKRESRAPNRRRALNYCRNIVEKWKPDLIHIHGTERFYGLLTAREIIRTPTVISIQGMLGPYSEWRHYFGSRTILDVIKMHRWVEPLLLRGQFWNYWRFKRAAKIENEIIRGNVCFLGRTSWDRSHVLSLNQNAIYHHVGEVLREPFWHKRWDMDHCQRGRIIFTNAGHPRKGAEILLEAVNLLKSEYPDIEVRIAGQISRRSGFGRYLRKKIRTMDLRVVELGALNAEEMTEELVKSHVFVSPSFIDNSPNAVGEAQLIGMPVISSYTGGTPSMIEEGRTGLFFPNSDAPVLAARLREIFENDDLARKLGERAHEAARERHDPRTVMKQLIYAYEDVLGRYGRKMNGIP